VTPDARRKVLDLSVLEVATRSARRTAGRPEAAEQRAGLDLLTRLGWAWWRAGQRDARGTQDPGVPDVIALHPDHGVLFWECKRETGGRLSFYQRAFQAQCESAGVPYVVGPCSALSEYLTRQGRDTVARARGVR
jgi:hypothetical protein